MTFAYLTDNGVESFDTIHALRTALSARGLGPVQIMVATLDAFGQYLDALDPVISHPGETTWYRHYGPLPEIGPCPHRCPHTLTKPIAWGPDFDHFELVQCVVEQGCAAQCRAWHPHYPRATRITRPLPTGWVQVQGGADLG